MDRALALCATLTVATTLCSCSSADQSRVPLMGSLAPMIDASTGAIDPGRVIALPYPNGVADLCPVGLPPDDAGCPATLPGADTCCTSVGLVCAYPGSDGGPTSEQSHPYALCTDISATTGKVAIWEVSSAVDRNICDPLDDAGLVVAEEDAGTSCADRPLVPCDPVSPQTAQEALNAQVQQITDSCGQFECTRGVQVDFEDGCVTNMEFTARSYLAPSFAPCIAAALAASRFACAEGLSCALAHGPECP